MHLALQIAAGVAFLLGVLTLASGIAQTLHYRGSKSGRVARLPLTPIDQLQGGREAVVEGWARATDHGLVVSPLSGRQVLAYRLEVDVWFHEETRFRHATTLADQRPCWVQDGSGASAWVAATPLLGQVVATRYTVADRDNGRFPAEYALTGSGSLPPTQAASPEIEAWLRSQSGQSHLPLRADEQLFGEGAPACVLGTPEVSPDAARAPVFSQGLVGLFPFGRATVIQSARHYRRSSCQQAIFGLTMLCIGSAILIANTLL